MYNECQELKGNIRVYCRVKPLTGTEGHSTVTIGADSLSLTVEQSSESFNGTPQSKASTFYFDRIFSPGASQEAIFNEVSQLVQSSLDGYRVCIFAYGQTGSGKTYTMEGPRDLQLHSGIIPRSVFLIFENIQKYGQLGWKYQVEVSFLEIYNEGIKDLLLTTSVPSTFKYEIKHTIGKESHLIAPLPLRRI